jgi:hypothetical protein
MEVKLLTIEALEGGAEKRDAGGGRRDTAAATR